MGKKYEAIGFGLLKSTYRVSTFAFNMFNGAIIEQVPLLVIAVYASRSVVTVVPNMFELIQQSALFRE